MGGLVGRNTAAVEGRELEGPGFMDRRRDAAIEERRELAMVRWCDAAADEGRVIEAHGSFAGVGLDDPRTCLG